MDERTLCLIITPGGDHHRVVLPRRLIKAEGVSAPDWLVRRLGVHLAGQAGWRLRPLPAPGTGAGDSHQPPDGAAFQPRLCLVRDITAAARTPFDPRQARLKKERLALMRLNEESDYVRVVALEVLPGSEPEHYRITFLCRGIIGVDQSRQPKYGERHRVSIHCDEDFPSEVPQLRWETEIWHPNIQHLGHDRGVCVNKSEWLGGMGLDDLVRLMFEMVQYKNYHADLTPPYPLDPEVAQWVREYAEPRGVVDKRRGIFVDNKPFTRPTVIERISVLPSPPPPQPRIRVLTPPTEPSPPIRVHGPDTRRIKIRDEK